MIGLLYIFLCFTVGWAICAYAFPNLSMVVEKDYAKRKISISPYLLLLPTWYVIGTLTITWATYLTAYLFRAAVEPLFYANIIVMPLAFLASAFIFYRRILMDKQKKLVIFCNDKKVIQIEFLLLAAITLLACILMWTTFFVKAGNLYVGVSVFSDFSPHVGMIRSFSYGNNFPTTYPHYAGEDIRYHFMFQFLAGNLEYLGLRIDYAFNIPSIISFVSAFLLLYLLAVKITGKIGAGILACLFFAFRSSKTLFTYLSGLPKGTNIMEALMSNTDFISDTPNEDWGLWNLNVYCNQRHLALGLAVIFLVLILLLPRLYEMFEDLKQSNFNKTDQKKKNYHKTFLKKVAERLKVIFFTADGWLVKDLKMPIAVGVLLGSMSFFHGSAVIGCLMVLFVMALLSKRRLEYLIIAVITISMSFIQTHFFIHGAAVSTQFLFGFIAENKTLFGVASYLGRLLGILPFVLLVAFCLEKGVGRYLLLAFTAPLIFAFCISMTIDVTVNHKYIMMSCILLGIFAATVVMQLLERRDIILRLVGVFLIILLTATGIYDFVTVLAKNTPESAIVLKLEDPITKWIDENSDSRDIFLTYRYTINQVVLGGAMLYEGHPYYPWSAGYDTDKRTARVKEMYEAQSPSELMTLVKENNIRFIIVDRDNRVTEDYNLNEENIRATYECVKWEGEGEWMTSIYDTKKPLSR
ncbi:MAG: putative rane protein [Herbinix sp.]|jgi:hypothetical protein|nr:putative rane protein [Herbinix sp.]